MKNEEAVDDGKLIICNVIACEGCFLEDAIDMIKLTPTLVLSPTERVKVHLTVMQLNVHITVRLTLVQGYCEEVPWKDYRRSERNFFYSLCLKTFRYQLACLGSSSWESAYTIMVTPCNPWEIARHIKYCISQSIFVCVRVNWPCLYMHTMLLKFNRLCIQYKLFGKWKP